MQAKHKTKNPGIFNLKYLSIIIAIAIVAILSFCATNQAKANSCLDVGEDADNSENVHVEVLLSNQENIKSCVSPEKVIIENQPSIQFVLGEGKDSIAIVESDFEIYGTKFHILETGTSTLTRSWEFTLNDDMWAYNYELTWLDESHTNLRVIIFVHNWYPVTFNVAPGKWSNGGSSEPKNIKLLENSNFEDPTFGKHRVVPPDNCELMGWETSDGEMFFDGTIIPNKDEWDGQLYAKYVSNEETSITIKATDKPIHIHHEVTIRKTPEIVHEVVYNNDCDDSWSIEDKYLTSPLPNGHTFWYNDAEHYLQIFWTNVENSNYLDNTITITGTDNTRITQFSYNGSRIKSECSSRLIQGKNLFEVETAPLEKYPINITSSHDILFQIEKTVTDKTGEIQKESYVDKSITITAKPESLVYCHHGSRHIEGSVYLLSENVIDIPFSVELIDYDAELNETITKYTFSSFCYDTKIENEVQMVDVEVDGELYPVSDTRLILPAESNIRLNISSKYLLSFDANGGVFDDSETMYKIQQKVGENIALPETEPSLTDYNFLGWFDAAEGGNKITTEKIVEEPSSETAVKTAYAHWSSNVQPEPTPEKPEKINAQTGDVAGYAVIVLSLVAIISAGIVIRRKYYVM